MLPKSRTEQVRIPYPNCVSAARTLRDTQNWPVLKNVYETFSIWELKESMIHQIDAQSYCSSHSIKCLARFPNNRKNLKNVDSAAIWAFEAILYNKNQKKIKTKWARHLLPWPLLLSELRYCAYIFLHILYIYIYLFLYVFRRQGR